MNILKKAGIVLSLAGILYFSGRSRHYSNQIESLARECGISNSSEFLPEQNQLCEKMRDMENERTELYRHPERYEEYKELKGRSISIGGRAGDAQHLEDKRYLNLIATDFSPVFLFLLLSKKTKYLLPQV